MSKEKFIRDIPLEYSVFSMFHISKATHLTTSLSVSAKSFGCKVNDVSFHVFAFAN